VRKGIDLAVELGMPSVKINCVVMKGFNDDELCDFVELTREKNIDVRFIECVLFRTALATSSSSSSSRSSLSSSLVANFEQLSCYPICSHTPACVFCLAIYIAAWAVQVYAVRREQVERRQVLLVRIPHVSSPSFPPHRLSLQTSKVVILFDENYLLVSRCWLRRVLPLFVVIDMTTWYLQSANAFLILPPSMTAVTRRQSHGPFQGSQAELALLHQ
jgi:hypothetical protein